MSKRTRDRQLAKLAARRQAERRAAARRRSLIVGGVAGVVAVGVVAVGLGLLLGGGDGSAATTPTPTPSPSAEPGSRTGTVTPRPPNESGEVACGAESPPEAGRPKPQFAGPPPMTIDRKADHTATLVTSCGTIVIRLDAKAAPRTVNSFVFLAEHGYFDGQYFHRLDTSIDVIQGGDPEGTGSGGPGYAIPDELGERPTYPPGTVAMANAGPDTGGSQFFIVAGPDGRNLNATPNYTVFGRVVRGLDVARRILALPIQDPDAADAGDLSGQRPAEAVYLERVTVRARGA